MKFRFKDGTIIEVSDAEGKTAKEVKEEVKKVYKEFKDSQVKDFLGFGKKNQEENTSSIQSPTNNNIKLDLYLIQEVRKFINEGKSHKECLKLLVDILKNHSIEHQYLTLDWLEQIYNNALRQVNEENQKTQSKEEKYNNLMNEIDNLQDSQNIQDSEKEEKINK